MRKTNKQNFFIEVCKCWKHWIFISDLLTRQLFQWHICMSLQFLNTEFQYTSCWVRKKICIMFIYLNSQSWEKGYTGLNIWNVVQSRICVIEHLTGSVLMQRWEELGIYLAEIILSQLLCPVFFDSACIWKV